MGKSENEFVNQLIRCHIGWPEPDKVGKSENSFVNQFIRSHIALRQRWSAEEVKVGKSENEFVNQFIRSHIALRQRLFAEEVKVEAIDAALDTCVCGCFSKEGENEWVVVAREDALGA